MTPSSIIFGMELHIKKISKDEKAMIIKSSQYTNVTNYTQKMKKRET